jgi:hypothetical protein
MNIWYIDHRPDGRAYLKIGKGHVLGLGSSEEVKQAKADQRLMAEKVYEVVVLNTLFSLGYSAPVTKH